MGINGKRYGTGSVSDLSINHVVTWSMLRSLTPLVYPQIFAPEARRKLAGGGARA